MNLHSPLSSILRTNCTIIESVAEIELVKSVFDYSPHQFLPVVAGLKFVGVIRREEFYQKYVASDDQALSAGELISKEAIFLTTDNTIAEAREVFDAQVFELIAITDEDGDLAGVVLREDVMLAIAKMKRHRRILSEIRRRLPLFFF